MSSDAVNARLEYHNSGREEQAALTRGGFFPRHGRWCARGLRRHDHGRHREGGPRLPGDGLQGLPQQA